MMSEFRMSMAMLPKRVLLVLDDDPQVCRLMERCMKDNFDGIICVMDPLSAHEVLEQQRITHILADLRLGGPSDGAVFLTLWKREFADVERAVIFTAADVRELELPAEVDAVVSKADGIESIVAALLGEDR